MYFSSCKFERLVKSTDLDLKYKMAVKYYEKHDFVRAQTLLEELVSVYRGTSKGEEVMFYYAYCDYNLGDYALAGYHFKSFVKSFPASKKAEECAYMSAYCYMLMSPIYSLDQSDTKIAIDEFQSFVNKYPKSERVQLCNENIDKLHEKLERKAYEIAKLYYHMEDYKASVSSFSNVIADFPGSKYTEELMYLTIKSYYLLALNSIEEKKPERVKLAIDSYFKFIDAFPKSKYLKDAESVYESVLKLKEKNNIKNL